MSIIDEKIKKKMNKCRSEPSFTITPEEIYNLNKKTIFGELEGYEPPRHYFDYKAVIWDKKRQEIKAKHVCPWPPSDWKEDKQTMKKIPPQKTNFIDDQIKWAKSFINEERAKKVREDLESKNHPIQEYYPSPWDIKPGPSLKERFLKEEKEKMEARKRMEAVPEFKVNAVDQVKEKIKQDEQSKVSKKGKPNFSKCDRVTIVADAEYVGESIPFYKTPPLKDGEDPKNGNKLFFPSKEPTWNKAPAWSFNMRNKMGHEKEGTVNTYLKAREDMLNERAEKALEKSGSDLKKYVEEPFLSYEKVNKHGRLPFTINKRYEYEKTPQYIEARKKRDFTPGPNHYWDDGKAIYKSKKSPDEKEYIMSREKTFKRVNIPYLRKQVF